MSKKKKEIQAQVKEQVKKENDSQSVKMKFKEDKFYNDFTKAHFEKDKIYEIKGADQIQRWLKRGGEIVSGELTIPKVEDNSSKVVENKHSESNPHGSEEEPKQEEVLDEVDSQEPALDIESIQDEQT